VKRDRENLAQEAAKERAEFSKKLDSVGRQFRFVTSAPNLLISLADCQRYQDGHRNVARTAAPDPEGDDDEERAETDERSSDRKQATPRESAAERNDGSGGKTQEVEESESRAARDRVVEQGGRRRRRRRRKVSDARGIDDDAPVEPLSVADSSSAELSPAHPP
jgi:hypothetical protein